RLGFQVIFAPPGIILALLFITYPFVVRTIQPVLEELDPAQEEAAATLGAGPIRTFFRVTVPELSFALLSGTILSFARAIGEFGSIVIVAGNIPLKTQTAAVYVWGEVESNNRLGASAVSVVMMAITFSLVLGVDWMQRRRARERSQ
ncbi:MAG: ABC transporter permease, partial [Acidobacteria bacterium]|nr:ABC transporter permease [Acidobacteriota bacterium]